MREGRRRRRIGVVVGRHIDRLHRRDRALLRRGDALLQLAHFREQRRLVADGRRHAAQQCRNLRPRLREPEDVVDEEKDVLSLRVAEVLGDRQRRQADTQSRAGRLRHLSVHQRGARLRHVIHVDDTRLLELEPEVVAFAGALSNTAEHGDSAVLGRDVVDELHDDDGLADAGAAEQTDLAALQIGFEQIDDLDSGLEHPQLGRLVFERGRMPMDRPTLLRLDRPVREVHRFAQDVEHSAKRLGTNRHRNGCAGVDDVHPSRHAVGRLHRDRPHAVLA